MRRLLTILTVILGFLLGLLIGVTATIKPQPEPQERYVRNYVGEELYMMTQENGLTKAKVFQQDLFERGKYYYLDNGSQTYALLEEDFMKLRGQQKDLRPKKK